MLLLQMHYLTGLTLYPLGFMKVETEHQSGI